MKFSTERLLLRSIDIHDTQDIFEIRSNPEINRFVQRNSPKNTFESFDFILNIKKKEAQNDMFFFGISEKDNPKLIGTVCLWKFSADRKNAELGYELLPTFHGKGIMSEAVNAILSFGFNDLNLEQIDAFTNGKNVNSQKLLTKNGFTLNANRKDENNLENFIFELPKSTFISKQN